MKLIYKRFIACLCAVLCIVSTGSMPVYAATAELEMNLSASEVEVGDWIVVSLRFKSSENLAGIYARITYDPNVLEYTGGDAEGDTGSLTLSKMEAEASQTLEYTLYFTAKAQGNTTITVAESGMYDTQAQSIGSPVGSRDIVVNPSGTLSSDAALKSLMVSYGVLQPAFSPDVTEYTMQVPNDISVVTITAVSNDVTAAVQVAGVSELAVGENVRSITVMAPDGTTRVYTVRINRLQAEESSQESSGNESSGTEESSQESSGESSQEESSGNEYGIMAFKVDGLTLYLQSVPEGIKIPSGFTAAAYDYQGTSYKIAQNSDQTIQLFYLTDFKGENGAFYLYDSQQDVCLNGVPLYAGRHVQILLDADQGGKVPRGCSLETAQIEGRKIRVYVAGGLSAAEAREYIVFCMNEDGMRDYYRYDVQTGTMGYYMDSFEDGSTPEESSQTEESSVASANSGNSQISDLNGGSDLVNNLIKWMPYIIIGLIVLILILAIIIILLTRSYRRRRNMQDDELEYDQKAVVEPEEKREDPEDPEDIQLDSEVFGQWKETTQRIPVMKMTEVHTTTIEAVTGIVPDIEHNTKTVSAQTAQPVQEKKSKPKSKEEEKDGELSADEFFL